MSLYTKLFDENKDADKLLYMIASERDEFPRYRDIFINPEGTEISVLCRSGGPNRDVWAEQIDWCQRIPRYLRDYDDKFDNTYMYFVYQVYPNDDRKMLKELELPKEDFDLKKKFDQAIADLDNPNSDQYKRAAKLAMDIQNQMETHKNGVCIYI